MYNKAWTHVVVGEELIHNQFLFWFQRKTLPAYRFPPISCTQADFMKFKSETSAQRKREKEKFGGRLMTNWIELTFAFAPCGGPTNSLRACQGFCCSPAPLQPDAGRNPVIRRRLKFASPSGSRDIAVAHSVVSGYLFCEQKSEEKKKEKN